MQWSPQKASELEASVVIPCLNAADTLEACIAKAQRALGEHRMMIIKASLFGEKVAEVPITLHPDGRKSHAPHLRTFRDGWRTLRFFLMYCPRWLFTIPGGVLVFLGMVGYAVAMPGLRLGRVAFDVHTLLFASLAILCGYQSILFAIFTKTFAISEGLIPEDPQLARFFKIVNLERGLILSAATILVGIILLAAAINQWRLETTRA